MAAARVAKLDLAGLPSAPGAAQAAVATKEKLAELDQADAGGVAERDQLHQLLPHLEQQLREAHRAQGQAVAAENDARIAEAEAVVAAAAAQLASAQDALRAVQAEADQALEAQYPEVLAERQRALPPPKRAIEVLIEAHLAHIDAISALAVRGTTRARRCRRPAPTAPGTRSCIWDQHQVG